MPWASDRIADDQAFGQRAVIVSAMGTDSEDVRLAPDNQDLLAVNLRRLDVLGEVGNWYALGHIWRIACKSRHGYLAPRALPPG